MNGITFTVWPEYASSLYPMGRCHVQADGGNKTVCGRVVGINWRHGVHRQGEEPLSGWCLVCKKASGNKGDNQ